jgi:hypothetical protein
MVGVADDGVQNLTKEYKTIIRIVPENRPDG